MDYVQLPLFADEPETKRCAHCRQVLPIAAFGKNRSRPDGLQHNCKGCQSAASKQHYYAHHEEKLAYASVWRRNNREYLRVAKLKNYYKHPEVTMNRIRRSRAEGRVDRVAEGLRYRAKHPEQIRANHSRRRAVIRKAVGKHSPADVKTQYQRQNGLCMWCSQPLPKRYHTDHVVPLIRGGSNSPDNIVCACPFCNLSKGDRLAFSEWQPPNPLQI